MTTPGSGSGWGFGFRPGAGVALGPVGRRLGGGGRWRFFSGIWLLYLLPGFTSAWTEHDGLDRVLRIGLLLAFCYVYIDLVARALTGGRAWLRWASPTLLAVLSLALLGLVGADALGTVVYVAVTVVILYPFRIGVPIAAAGTLLVGLASWIVPSWSGTDSWSVAGSVALGSLAAFGFQALIRRTWELRAAQQEVSRLAADRERMRIARDLHDLLGHSLTAAAVKAQLAGRLVERDPARAAAEIADVERLTRQVLADVRAAVAGYREVSLAVELATAREVLSAAGITAELPGAVDEVPAGLRELFGWAVREGITNAVRHSGAQRVRVTVTPSSVEIADDGRGAVGAVPGSGLTGLAERAAAVGGRLETGPTPTAAHRLLLTIPPTAASPVAPGPAEGPGSAEGPGPAEGPGSAGPSSSRGATAASAATAAAASGSAEGPGPGGWTAAPAPDPARTGPGGPDGPRLGPSGQPRGSAGWDPAPVRAPRDAVAKGQGR